MLRRGMPSDVHVAKKPHACSGTRFLLRLQLARLKKFFAPGLCTACMLAALACVAELAVLMTKVTKVQPIVNSSQVFGKMCAQPCTRWMFMQLPLSSLLAMRVHLSS